jgi:hypothetical protein
VEFDDLDAKCSRFALTKAEPGTVGLTLSLESNGDIDIFVSTDEARTIVGALEAAIQVAAKGTP